MDKSRIVKSTIAEISFDNGIIYIDYYPMQEANLENAEELVNLIKTNFADVLPALLLSDISKLKNTTKEARDYIGSDAVAPLLKASAVIANSLLSKIIGNLFLKFNKPTYPTKLFSDKQAALLWLETYRNQ